MINYTLNKYDFVKYLLDTRQDVKMDETIFWLSTFPLPASIVYDVFERRGPLIKTYLDHLYGVLLYAKTLREATSDWEAVIREQPNPLNKDREDYFLNLFKDGFKDVALRQAIESIALKLMVYGYDPSEHDLFDAICHSGRKYSRLYIPKPIKDVIRQVDADLLTIVATGNRDMFGQPVADEFQIYRMGFSDKLVAIFNDLMHFIISHSDDCDSSLANASDIRISQPAVSTKERESIVYGSVSDGGVWEPTYKQATVSAIFNEKHPFCDLMKRGLSGEDLIQDFVTALAECEYDVFSEREKKMYEAMRENISKKLRQKSLGRL